MNQVAGNPEVTKAGTRPGVSDAFNERYDDPHGMKDRWRTPEKTVPQDHIERSARAEYPKTTQRDQARSRAVAKARARRRLKKRLAAKVGLGNTTGKMVSRQIVIWGGQAWLYFIFPFAVIGTVFLGLALGVEELLAGAEIGDGGFGSVVLSTLTVFFFTVLELVKQVFFLQFNPQDFLLVFLLIPAALGSVLLAIIWLVYTLAFLQPLGGKAGGAKYGLFLLVTFCVLAPVFNLLPWWLLWVGVMYKYPK